MSTHLKHDLITGSLGTFRISTIQTFAGGGEDCQLPGFPFKDSEYASDSPWPFETMVFKEHSSRGLYHAPYSTKEEALAGHELMIKTIKQGAEFGGNVEGPFGNPSTTPEQWRERSAASKEQP